MSQQINLFNPVFLKQRKVFTALAMAQALGVLVAGLALLAVYSQRSVAVLEGEAAASAEQLAKRQARLEQANRELAPREPSAELKARVAAAEEKLAALRDVSGTLYRGGFGNTAGYAEYFRAFARQDVGDLWLTGLTISGPQADIGIEGRALQAELVPAYIARLATEPVLKGKRFGSLKMSTAAKKDGAPAAPYLEFSLQSAAAAGEEG